MPHDSGWSVPPEDDVGIFPGPGLRTPEVHERAYGERPAARACLAQDNAPEALIGIRADPGDPCGFTAC
eukprot:4948029-Lingulodinium_polyedra.AAC.1